MDSSVINTLVKTARRVHAEGEKLVLVIPPKQTPVARLAQMTRLGEIRPIHSTRDAAVASIESEA